MVFLSAAALPGGAAEGIAPPAPAAVAGAPLSLRQAIDRSLQYNLGLAVSRLDALRSLDAVEVTAAPFDPTVAWTNRLGGSRPPAYLVTGAPADRAYDSDFSVSQRFSWGGSLAVGAGLGRAWTESGGVGTASVFDVSSNIAYVQPLLAGGWRDVNLSALIGARESASRSRLSLRAAALDLLRDAEITYWSLASARTLVALRETSLRSAESLAEQIRARRTLGDATVLEELQADADVSSQRVAVLSARQIVDGAEMNLRRLLGQGDAAAVEQPIAVEALPTAEVAAPEPFGAWIRVVAGFDFGAAIQRSNIVQAQALVARAEQDDLPSLDLAVGATRAGAATAGAGGGLDNYRRSPGWNNFAELRLSIPLGFRESAATLRSAVRARRQAELRLADARQNLVFTARASWRELEAARALVLAATSALDLQRQSYAGERARYDAGQSDILRVLQAQAALDSAQLNWVQAHFDARAASAKVARLDGSSLPRHGFTLDTVEAQVGAGLGAEDPLPPLPAFP